MTPVAHSCDEPNEYKDGVNARRDQADARQCSIGNGGVAERDLAGEASAVLRGFGGEHLARQCVARPGSVCQAAGEERMRPWPRLHGCGKRETLNTRRKHKNDRRMTDVASTSRSADK
jgi:hypothetical protein